MQVCIMQLADIPLCARQAWLSQQIPGMLERHQVIIEAQCNIGTGYQD